MTSTELDFCFYCFRDGSECTKKSVYVHTADLLSSELITSELCPIQMTWIGSTAVMVVYVGLVLHIALKHSLLCLIPL